MGRTFLLTAVIVVNAIVLSRSFVAGEQTSFLCFASMLKD